MGFTTFASRRPVTILFGTAIAAESAIGGAIGSSSRRRIRHGHVVQTRIRIEEGILIVDAEQSQIEGDADPLHRAAEHDGTAGLARPDVAGILHHVRVGDQPSTLNDKAGARPGILGVAPPWLPIVGSYALDGELWIKQSKGGKVLAQG